MSERVEAVVNPVFGGYAITATSPDAAVIRGVPGGEIVGLSPAFAELMDRLNISRAEALVALVAADKR